MLNCLFAPTPLSLVVWSVLPWLAIVAFLGLPSSLSSEPDQSNATRRAYIRAGFILSVLYMGIAFTFKTKASLSWTGKTLRNICFVLLVFIGIIWAPDTVYSYLLVPYVEITAALWLLIQSVILVDCVHAVHLFILTMAHNTHKSQGLRFALIYYIFHLSLGATSFFLLYELGGITGSGVGSTTTTNNESNLAPPYYIVMSFCFVLFKALCVVCLLPCVNKGFLIPALIALYSTCLCQYIDVVSGPHDHERMVAARNILLVPFVAVFTYSVIQHGESSLLCNSLRRCARKLLSLPQTLSRGGNVLTSSLEEDQRHRRRDIESAGPGPGGEVSNLLERTSSGDAGTVQIDDACKEWNSSFVIAAVASCYLAVLLCGAWAPELSSTIVNKAAVSSLAVFIHCLAIICALGVFMVSLYDSWIHNATLQK